MFALLTKGTHRPGAMVSYFVYLVHTNWEHIGRVNQSWAKEYLYLENIRILLFLVHPIVKSVSRYIFIKFKCTYTPIHFQIHLESIQICIQIHFEKYLDVYGYNTWILGHMDTENSVTP